MPGPVPKRESQRRRRNTPASQPNGVEHVGGASRQPELGYDAHFLVIDMWVALDGSPESKFFSAPDWQRARTELWYLNELLQSGRTPGSQAWAAVQSALTSLLVSPAEKRRVGIELDAAHVDEDEAAADAEVLSLVGKFGS